MKKIIIFNLVTYAFIAFCNVSINPVEWNGFSRFALIVLFVVYSFYRVGIDIENRKEKNKPDITNNTHLERHEYMMLIDILTAVEKSYTFGVSHIVEYTAAKQIKLKIENYLNQTR